MRLCLKSYLILTLSFLASTWAGRPTLSPDLLEFLIQQCDGDDELNGNPVATRMVSKPSHNPFSVFAIHHPRKGSMLAELLDLQGLNDSIPPSLSFGPKTTATDCALLQHYVNHVALLMMPYKDSRNPWIHYPMTALRGSSSNQPALYHGLLAQSAFNIAQLHNDPSMMETGLKHYDLAIKELSLCLATARRHQCQFSAMLATIMTLLFAEVRRKTQFDRHPILTNVDLQWAAKKMEIPLSRGLESLPKEFLLGSVEAHRLCLRICSKLIHH